MPNLQITRTVEYPDVAAAHDRIRDAIYLSPCVESQPLSDITGSQVLCKLDYLQRTGSFKERGARNFLATMDDAARCAGVIAASAGNHALGLSYHGKLLGAPVTVVMPRFAPLVKVRRCRQFGATVILHGNTFDEARAHALQRGQQQALTYVHGFDDPAIIAGQGTVGLEIVQQVDRADAVIVPVGGGGLIAGVALAIKHHWPEAQVIGVEPRRAACFTAARRAGHPVEIETRPTLADGLQVAFAGPRAFATAQPLVDRVVTVTESELALAILRIAEMEKGVVEGAGASTLAACLAGKLPELRGKRIVLCLSGGNIDPAILGDVIDKGLVADGRLCRFTAVVYDRPGGLAALATAIAEAGANIRDIVHDRPFSGGSVSETNIHITVETRDREHQDEVRQVILRHGELLGE